MKIEKGASFNILIPDLGESRKIHIVELIENDMVVYKYYGKHKQWWHYFVDDKATIISRYEFANKPTKSRHDYNIEEAGEIKKEDFDNLKPRQ